MKEKKQENKLYTKKRKIFFKQKRMSRALAKNEEDELKEREKRLQKRKKGNR